MIDNCKHGSFRITNGYSNNNGLIEVCVHGSWIGFCTSRSFSPRRYSSIFTHVCNQLGYQCKLCYHHGTIQLKFCYSLGHVEIDGSIFKANRSNPQSYVSPWSSSCRPQSSLLDCVRNNTYYGYQYQQSCSDPIGVLCCPNGKIS